MGNTEGGRMNRFVQKQVYSSGTIPVLQTSCPPRTTLSTQLTPAESSKYAANSFVEVLVGGSGTRTTYQGGVSQEEIKALLSIKSKRIYRSEDVRVAVQTAECPGYAPPFSSIIPPVPVCPPLPPPPALEFIPGTNPAKCINTK